MKEQTDPYAHLKDTIAPVQGAMYDFDIDALRAQLHGVCAPDVLFRLCFPFETIEGVDPYVDRVYAPLATALPDLERRDWIVMAGPTPEGADWVGCGGTYVGAFKAPSLDIPPTGHLVHMRFHEFFRFEEGRIVEMQALWDIPEVMMQAGAWPLTPSLGREWHVPGPASCDGLVPGPRDTARSDAACRHIIDMLDHLKRHPSQGGPEVMEM